MKFHHIDPSIPSEQAQLAQDKFDRLLMCLATSERNTHIMGGPGNPYQMLVLMLAHHELIHNPDTKIELSQVSSVLYWEDAFLRNASIEDIRSHLNSVFPDLVAKLGITATDTQSLMSAFRDGSVSLSGLPELCQLVDAVKMVTDLANALDAGDTSQIPSVGAALLQIPYEIVIFVARTCLGLERVVGHLVDEDPNWDLILKSMNKVY
jgi:hypothetical protein